MGTRFTQGFTIIETMLVLAVTGVLIATLLVGVGSSINTQRYKDSVSSFKSLLQGEYDQVNDVTNDHPENQPETCGAGAIATDDPSGVGPGQSDCILIGRYISVVNDTISQASILGYPKTQKVTTSDIDDITMNYDLGVSTDSIQTTTLEWGAQIAWPVSGIDKGSPGGRSIGILIIRSPKSGTIYTFTSNTVNTNAGNNAFDPATLNAAALKAMVTTTPSSNYAAQTQRFICIDPDPGSLTTSVPEKLSVVIDQNASSSNSIEQRSDSINTTLGEASACNK